MSKRKSAKYKLDRRMGENIWGRPHSPVNRRSYGPGQHGQRRGEQVVKLHCILRSGIVNETTQSTGKCKPRTKYYISGSSPLRLPRASALSTPRMVRTSRWFHAGLVSMLRKVRRVAAAREAGLK